MSRKCRLKSCRRELPKAKDCADPFQKGGFCDINCMAKHGLEKSRESIAKAERKRHSLDKKRVKRRSDWLANLQTLVNQYVVHVRDKGKPCCTCGTTNPNIKYDAGHCFTRGARSDLRFELTNIHIQCSVNCNQMHSGRQGEYKEFIKDSYGEGHLSLLEDRSKWPSLSETFPDWQSIEREIKRYREILRDNGLRPNI